jgi:competence protein ComEC
MKAYLFSFRSPYTKTLEILPLFFLVFLLLSIYLGLNCIRDIRAVVFGCLIICSFLIAISVGQFQGYSSILLLIVCIGLFLWLQGSMIVGRHTLFLGLPYERIDRIHGKLVLDSSISAKENQVLTVAIDNCMAINGDTTNASGQILAVGGQQSLMVAGTVVVLHGKFIPTDSGTLIFITETIAVDVPKDNMYRIIRDVRRQLLLRMSYRLKQFGNGPGDLFSLLLLGRSQEPSSSLRQLSVESGCAHILALSGMHLQFFAGLFTLFLSRIVGKRRSRILALLPVVLFLFIAGPKPSLLRSAIMFAISLDTQKKLNSRQALILACIIQIIVFPRSIVSLGCLLSYSALAGILLFQQPAVVQLRRYISNPLAVFFCTSCAALFFSGPCSMLVFARWYPVGLFLAPIMGPLALFMMFLGIVWMTIPLPPIVWLSEKTYALFFALLRRGSSFSLLYPDYGKPFSLYLFILVMLTVLMVLLYACRRTRTRSKHHHEMGLSIRFPKCNHSPVG